MTGAVVNTDPLSPGVIAITKRGAADMVTTTIYSMVSLAEDEHLDLKPIHEFTSYRRAIALQGNIFVASDVDNIVRLIDTGSGQQICQLRVPLEHDDPTLFNEEDTCMAVVLVHNHAITFCRRWIHLYKISNQVDGSSDVPSYLPATSHKWTWNIDTIVVSPRSLSRIKSDSPSFPLIDILIRFDTWFPWPVNIIHHYVLPPNPSLSDARSHSDTFESFEEDHAVQAELPYLFATSSIHGPFMIHSISSPIRLFTPSDMVLGRYGTALWLDAQSSNSGPAQAGDHGQRIAGKMLISPRTPPHTQMRTIKRTEDDKVSPGYAEEQPGNSSSGQAIHEGAIAHEPRMMVFHMQDEEDDWSRLALDEEEGRIAIGTVNGTVLLFEYVPRE
ncbi:uncharacterized protein FIBRA_04765 [Fibroporia radiculosa]|uniref:Cleavage/polyadenylation specificity factor A subunit N-terminal domain-containing protein n=1 Tax=Fibroporia radiculosa TaxID=599839 RepID=J4IAC3_9APHY|nr:uncharacterized protein FIBRA_04765 [Fibroporia radiculosa]CCM02661.1 predicted protein [Fibroporia radiculosa]